ncbi:tudor domain-containing 6-like [Triplophysa rosa]|uniref:Tudor domain-containing protein 6 n=1 Tax=Triplophysa rosa TaxID=992332 RepID=A0A9W7TSX0_TRIRA|nr:tudor domain-containing 6-like [Triplophysa rosa]KAI7802289.1 putative tudor domain-containing protein 6 [Triplophysa rosa]
MCSIPGLPSTGSNVPVLILRVNLSPSCVLVKFWGNFDQDRKFAYQQLKKEIQYPREGFCESDGNPGDLCLVRVYETWYRARVVSRDAEEYSLFLIDEGRTLHATLNTLAWGKSEFFYLPPEGEFCVLANVLPLSPDKWTTMALEFMKTFCGRRVSATVQDVLVPHRTFLLDIPCLSRQMFEMGFAKKLSSERFKEFVTRSLQANSGFAVDLQKIPFIGNKPFELIEQMEKTQSYMYPELQTDTVETVVVTEVTNPFSIFCQLKVFSQELRKLTEQITQHYEGRIGTNFARPENLGSPCASRGSDGKWYRSVLQQVMSAYNVVEVLHVDYGKKQFVQVDNLRPLASEFFRMPVVTYVCSLHGIDDGGVGWTTSQIDFLKSVLLNRTVIAKFQYQSLSEGVHYVTLHGEENTNINKLFELKQKCVLDSELTHDDFAVQKSPSSQKSKISERSESKHPDGNTGIVDCCNLQKLPLKFQELPAVAVKCSLHGIKPKLKHWDEKATSFFSRIVEDKVLDLHIQDKFQDTHIVQLVEPSLDGENDVSKLLCSTDLAESEKSFVGNPGLRSCSLKMAHTADTVSTSTQPQTPSSSSVVTESASAFKESLFPIGSSLEVTVSYIESPNDFWCQKTQNAACLEVLMHDIQCFYAHSKFQPPFEAACVARHPKIGIWYRALVIHKHQTPHVDVIFIDYGQTKKVGVEDLRKITPEFLKMKGQAFRCSLYNLISPVSHSAIDWSPEATLQLQDFVDTAASTNVPLKCTIFAIMYDAQKVVFNVVDLETPFQSICNLLVQRHLADRAPSKRSPISPFLLVTYYYSSHVIKTGCEEEVSVTCVKSATLFFCHLGRNSDQIEKLADKVNSLCIQLAVTKCPQTFGTVCFVKFTDGLWYRGQIKSTKPSTVVHFVDYGDTLEVNKSCLLPVPIEAGDIMTVPVQAIECGLSDIPDNVPGEVGKWFQNLAEGGCFKALIVAKEPGGKLIVELYDGKTKVNALIRQKFRNDIPQNELSAIKDFGTKNKIAQSLATHVRESFSGLKTSPPNRVQHFSQSQIGNRFESTRNRWGDHKDGGPEPTKEFQRCHNTTKPEISPRKPNDGKPNELMLPCQSKKDGGVKIKPQMSLKESQIPVKLIKSGMEASVFISHCNGPFSFFVQLATDEDDIYALVEKLNDGQLKGVNLDPTDIYEGDLVRAVFPDDNSWYRAAVRKNTGDTIDVEFVDFGNTAAVSPSKICQLEHSFASFPRYDIHCSLNKQNVDSTDQASSFKQVIEENVDKVVCTFVKLSGAVWEVTLDVNGVVLGSTCKDESPPTAELKSTSVKQMSDVTTCTYYKNPDLSVGQMIDGYASVIKGPQLFWCQYATDKLQEIADVLQNVGDVLENTMKEDSLTVGSAGIALFAEDDLWYRAKVTTRDHDTLSVTFVDYGNESKVNVGDVRALPSKLSDIPPQAFDCQLEGFDVSKGFWDENADDEFYELVNDKLLNITVERMGTSEMPHFVKLEFDGVVINDAMLQYWESHEGPSVKLLNGGRLVPYEDSVVTEINIGSEKTLEADTDVTDKICTPDNKIQQEEETDVPEGTEVENEVQAVPLVMSDESVHSPDLIIVTEELVSACDTEHEPIADVTSSLLDLTNQHDFAQETLDAKLHPPVLAKQSEELSDAAPKDDSDGILQQELHSELCHVEPESLSYEIIRSDFGCIRQATEKKPVGSECFIWSHVRRNWCKAQVLKVSEDAALVLLVDHDSEVVVDPLNIYEILPEKPLEPLSGEASVLDDELTKVIHAAQMKIASQGEDAEYEAAFASSSEEPKGDESCKRLVEQMDPGDEPAEQLQAEEPVSSSEGLVEFAEEVSGAGAQLVEILTSTACSEHLQNREPQDDISSSAGEQKGGANNMVDLLMDFLDVGLLKKVQEDICKTGTEMDALLEEFNSVTADLLVLTSDNGAESDTGSDDTLQEDGGVMEVCPDAEEYSCVQEIPQERPNASDCTSAEEQDLRVTHLTLKVEDESDDVIFVGVLRESQVEVCQPEQK